MLNFSGIYAKAEFCKTLPENSGSVHCFLCPRNCIIHENKSGFCGVRYNNAGQLYSLVYGYPSALQVDPIEKKPFAEFMRGTSTFSIGTLGCNLDCLFCQNYHLSRRKPTIKTEKRDFISPELIINTAKKYKSASIAFTYNEPTVWIEYAIDIAEKAKTQNLPVVLISNGFISAKAAEKFYPLIEAANIDMKGFSEDFYSHMTGGNLKTVLDSIEYLYSLKKHIEITNLVIPEKNDSFEMIKDFLDWVEKNLNKSVPLHFSAYHPMYKFKEVPRTPANVLYEIKEYAEGRGFTSVYLGNI